MRGVGLGVPVGGGARGRLVLRVPVVGLRVVLALILAAVAVGRRGTGRLVGLPVLRILVSGCLLGVGALVGGLLVLGGIEGGNLSGAGRVRRGVELVGGAHAGTYEVRSDGRGLS